MPEILLSSASSDASSALNQCNSASAKLYSRDCQPTDTVRAYNPYLVGSEPSLNDQTILGKLMAGNSTRKLTEMSQCLGAETVNSLAEFREHGSALGVGSVGTSTSVYMDRTNSFVKAIERYQNALLSYRDAVKSGSRFQSAKQIEARRAFDHLQTEFQNEMRVITSRSNSRRGTPLTSSERALNIARSSRRADKLYVANQAQAHNLVNFTKYAKVLGNGLTAIDFGSRVGNIRTSYLAGENWHREMFIQSTSFTLGAFATAAALKGGIALLAVFTPVGLVGLIAGGVAVAVGGAVAGYSASTLSNSRAGEWYDAIMDWLS